MLEWNAIPDTQQECSGSISEKIEEEIKRVPPEKIKGVPVRAIPGTETEYNNQTWITLIPSEGEDSRIWEFSLTTGKIVQTAR